MVQDPENDVSQPSTPSDEETVQYKTPGEGLAKVNEMFEDWSEILTNHSIQGAYAIIAANWAVHGTTGKILDNAYSKYSLAVIFGLLGVNILIAYVLSRLLCRRVIYAEKNREDWQRMFRESLKQQSAWPYTQPIEKLGVLLRELKTWAVLIAALLFVISSFAGQGNNAATHSGQGANGVSEVQLSAPNVETPATIAPSRTDN